MNLPGFSVRRPVLTIMVALIAVTLGLVSLTRLPIDLLPDIEFPVLTVAVNYPNASPQEMEELVAQPIERTVAAVPGVEEITSSSAEGTTNVSLRFAWGTDLLEATNDVRERLDRVLDDLPDEADRPSIRKFDPSAAPILLIGVSSGIDQIELRRLIDNRIIYRLQQVPGVAAIDVWGGPEREIQVRLDPVQVTALGLSLAETRELLRDANLNRPGGSIERGDTEFTVRVPGRFRDLDEIRNTVIDVRDGAVIRLGQVAQVLDTRKRETRIVRIDGEPGIRMAVRKQAEANTVEVARDVHRAVERLRNDYPQIRFNALFDTSEYIQRAIANASMAIIFGALLATAVLLFFLRNLRATLVIATAIPVSVVTTFALVYFGGFTLNLMTLGGLALGVGLMVDSAIVVLENIFRRFQGHGESATKAATEGAGEVAAAIVAGTLTTVAIFVPMFFAEDLAGQIFGQLAWVVAFSIGCALVVALTVVPMLGGRLLRADAPRAPAPLRRLGDGIGRMLAGIESFYRGILDRALAHPWRVIAAAVLAMVAAAAAVPQLGTEFMPATDEGEVRVSVDMAAGTRLSTVDRNTRAVMAQIRELVPEREATVESIGASSWRPQESAQGSVRIGLPPREEALRSSEEIAGLLREELDAVPGAEIRVRVRQPFFLRVLGGESGEDVQIEVRGFEFGRLQALAEQVEQRVTGIDGITDLRLSRETGEPQRLVRVDRQRAADQGVTMSAVADTVETAIAGRVASRFLDAGEEVDIRVQLAGAETLAARQLLELRVPSADGRMIRLGNIASLERATGPVVIDRKEQARLISVYANIEGRDTGSVVADVRAAISGIPLPDGYDVAIGGDYEQQEEAFTTLTLALILAIALVYMVLASLYESLRDPLIVMCTVPLALIGVVLALFVTNTTLNAQSLIGCVILVGLVVNNAILIVDQTNRLRERGEELLGALREAGRRRLRPILMTATTTALALLPLAIGAGDGGELQAPLARSVIGGLIVSTLVTLVLIPAIYVLVHRNDPPLKPAE